VTVASTLLLSLAFLLVGCAGAALLARVFAGLDEETRRDASIAFAVPVGLLAVGLPGWLLSVAFAVPIGGVAVRLGFVVAVAILAFLGRDLLSLRGGRRLLLPLLLPIGVFALFALLRAGAGEIRQTEKPMDFAILNALVTSESLPLQDPWFSGGGPLPYYHFGTYLFALVFRAAGTPPEHAYNILVALGAALAASAAFGAVRLRGGGRGVAVGGALFLAFAGTPDGLRQLLAGKPLGDLDFWVSSRRVVNTITEWPFFTLKLGDLHPHAVAMPLFLTFVGVAGRVATFPGLLLDGVLLGALLSANPWDLPAALAFLAAGNLVERGFGLATVRSVVTCGVAVPVLLPSLLSPRPELQGLRLVSVRTGSLEGFLHLGAMLAVPALAVGVALVRSRKRDDEALLAATFFPALGIALGILLKAPVLGLGVAFLAAVAYLFPHLSGALRAGFLFAGAATTVLLVPELIAVKDPYGEEMHRMNTVFKCYAAAGLALPVAGALLLPLALSTRRARLTIRAFLAAALVSTLPHPANAVLWAWRAGDRTLDGLTWMRRELPGDLAAIRWLRSKAPAGAVVLEAVGGAYSDHARIGSGSGRPTYLGWAGHEGLWRGAKGAGDVARRQQEVKVVYTSTDENVVRGILREGKIRYVVVGPLERNEFGPEPFPLRDRFKAVFSEQETTLYEVVP